MLLITSYTSYALTSKTSNIIHGNAPYLTFDGGRTRATNADGLLGITLSNGDEITPESNNSTFANPIELPIADQSLADIGMFVPIDTNEIDLKALIGPPYNYWRDDDGDGQGPDGITVTGSLSLAIFDKNDQPVARSEILNICNSPYKLVLSSTVGSLTTHYGVPDESSFNASNATYYVKPKTSPMVCFAKPSLKHGAYNDPEQWAQEVDFRGPVTMWNENKGFIPQSTNVSSYHLNFPTTGAHSLFFDLDIGGSGPLNWQTVSPNGDIKAIMTPNASGTTVRVVLEGPVATDAQVNSDEPSSLGNIDRPTLPQTFELVGRDSYGNEVVKYGFVLKQWFVKRGIKEFTYYSLAPWCANIGYNLPKVKDLTNATCQNISSGYWCQGVIGAIPASPNNLYQRHIGAGFFAEWGDMYFYDFNGIGARGQYYWTSEGFIVGSLVGNSVRSGPTPARNGLCVYP